MYLVDQGTAAGPLAGVLAGATGADHPGRDLGAGVHVRGAGARCIRHRPTHKNRLPTTVYSEGFPTTLARILIRILILPLRTYGSGSNPNPQKYVIFIHRNQLTQKVLRI